MSKQPLEASELVRIVAEPSGSVALRRDAFSALMERHQGMVYGCALATLGDVQLAEDAVQEAFIAAWQNIELLREPAAFSGWLYRITLWQCYRLKRGKKIPVVEWEEIEEKLPGNGSSAGCPQTELERAEAQVAVKRAVAALPENLRLPLVLFYMGGHSQIEIARFLELSAGTVKKRIFDARQKLKSSLGIQLGEEYLAFAPSLQTELKGKIMKWILPDNLESEYGPNGARIWEMLLAAAQGDIKKVKALAKSDSTLVTREFAYYTPMHFAVREGHEKVVQFLLEQGADATYKSGLGWQESPIGLARDRGYSGMVTMMESHLSRQFSISPAGQNICDAVRDGNRLQVEEALERDSSLVNAGDERGNTPLHWAVMTRRLEMMDLLVQRGADLEATRADGARPVHLCIHGDYWHRRKIYVVRDDAVVLGYLLGKGAVVDAGIAAHLGDVGRLEAILDATPEAANAANSYGYRPLSYAARRGYTDVVRLLLKRGAQPTAEERGAEHGLAFYEAVANNHTECARVLLEAGADPQAYVESSGNPLMRALSNKNQELIDLLYARGATGEMYHFLSEGRFDVVGEVLKAKPEIVNTGGDYGFLCMAVGFAPVEMVRLVLSYGPDLNRPWYANNHVGYVLGIRTPDRMDVLKMLLEAGANPNLPNWVGVTYLHKVAMSGSVEVAQVLLDYGADLEATDDEYCATPLGWAARWGRLEMVEFLLSRGAQLQPEGGPDWAIPLEWARKKGHSEILELLERKSQ